VSMKISTRQVDGVTILDLGGRITLGELVSAYTTVRNQGGELKLLNLTRKVHDLLQITKLYTVFDVKDDEASAIASYAHA
jgi:anti-sigma B factor antagonist